MNNQVFLTHSVQDSEEYLTIIKEKKKSEKRKPRFASQEIKKCFTSNLFIVILY